MNTLRGLAAVFLLRFLSLFPWSVLQGLGDLLGRWWYYSHTRSRVSIEANLRYCFPEQLDAERDALTRRALVETARTTLEAGPLWCWPKDRIEAMIVEVHGQSLMEQALARQKGVIALAPHLGNWEVVSFYLAQQAPTTSLYAPAKIPALDRLIHAGRTRSQSTLVPTNAGGVRALLKALKAGEICGILPDQVPEDGSGVFAPFFGRPAFSMTLLPSLVRRTGATVLGVFAKRREDGRGFDIHVLPTEPGINSEDDLLAVTAMNASVEHCVRVCPSQYQWGYKRFREREAGLSLYLEDRRLQVRRSLAEKITGSIGALSAADARVLNLTPGGLMLEADAGAVVGQRSPLQLHCASDSLPVEAQCLWCEAAEAGRYRSGWRIVYANHKDAVQLLTWLEAREERSFKVTAAMAGLGLLAQLPPGLWSALGHYAGRWHERFRTQALRNVQRNLDVAFAQEEASARAELQLQTLCYGAVREGMVPFLRLASPARLDRALPLSSATPLELAPPTEAGAAGRGAVLLLPNSGHWELILREIARHHSLVLLHQPPQMPWWDRMLYRAALRDGYAVLNMHDDYAQTVEQLVKAGHWVALLPDQTLITVRNCRAPVLGHDIPVPDFSFLARLGAPVWMLHLRPAVQGVGQEVVAQRLSALEVSRDRESAALEFTKAMEASIRDCPWQYHWNARVYPKTNRS